MQNSAKIYLSRYRHYRRKLKILERHIEQLREQAEDITAHLNPDKVQSSPKIHDPIAEAAASIADTEVLYATSQQECQRVLNEIVRTVDKVEDIKLQNILRLRYIESMTWDAIAQEMSYEVRQIYRLHGLALQEVKRIINQQEKSQ